MPINVKITADEKDLQEGFARAVKVTEEGAWRINSAMESMAARTDRATKSMAQNISSVSAQTTTSFNQMASDGAAGIEKLTDRIGSAVSKSWDTVKGYAESVKNAFSSLSDDQEHAASKISENSKTTKESIEDVGVGAGLASLRFGALGAVIVAVASGISAAAEHANEAAQRFADSGEALSVMSQKSGITTLELQNLSAASRMANLEAGTLSTAYARLTEASAKFGEDGKKVREALDAIGVGLRDGEGKGRLYRDIIADIADKFSTYADGAYKAALAEAIFGSKKGELIAMLNKGGAAFKEYMDSVVKSGSAVTDAETKRMEITKSNERVIEDAILQTQKGIDRSFQEIKETLSLNELAWSSWAKAIPIQAKAAFNIIGSEWAKLKMQLGGPLPSTFQSLLKDAKSYQAEGDAGLNAPSLDLSNPTTQKAPAPRILKGSDFEKTLTEEKNEEENILTWKAAQTEEYWNKAYKWAAGYYGKESELAKELWSKRADAMRGAVEKDSKEEKDTRVQEWEQGLQRIHDWNDNLYKDMTKVDLKYWQDALKIVEEGGEKHTEIWDKVVNKIQDIKRESYRKEQADQRAANDTLMSMKRMEADTAIAIERDKIKTRYELGKIDAAQRLAQETQLYQREFQEAINAKYAELAQAQAAGEMEIQDQARIYREIRRLQFEHNRRMTQAEDQAMLNTKKKADEIARGMSGAVNSMLFSTQTMAQRVQSLFQNIASHIIEQIIRKMVTAWLVGETTKTAATAAGETARLGVQKAAATEGLAVSFATKMKEVVGSAYSAAAHAYDAVAAIPYVGPFIAPAAAAVTFAAVMAFGSGIPSAAGGWDIPPGINPVVQAHGGEMVLPADISAGLKNMIGGGSSGGGDHYHLHLIDTKHAKGFIRKYAPEIKQAALAAHRDGH